MAARRPDRLPKFWQCACAALIGAVLAFSSSQAAEAQYREAQVKAAFLFRFTGYVDWPASALEAPAFTIAILGRTDVADELDRLLPGRTIKDLPARVRRIRRLSELGDAQMLHVAASYPDIKQVVHALADKPVLVVTDHSRGLDEGGMVNFLTLDRRVRFEISVAAAQRAHLKIGAELLALAASVRGAPDRAHTHCMTCTCQSDGSCVALTVTP